MRHEPVTLRARMDVMKTIGTEPNKRHREELARPMQDTLRIQTLMQMRMGTENQIASAARHLALGLCQHKPEAAYQLLTIYNHLKRSAKL